MVDYKIFKNRALLLQKFSGEIDKQELAGFFTELYSNTDYLDVSIIFSDFSNAAVALTLDDLEDVAHFIIATAPKVRHVKNAIIVQEPLITAYTHIYKEVMEAMPSYECEIFSTFSEGAKYIGYSLSDLKELINTF